MDIETYIASMREKLQVIREIRNISLEKLSPSVGVNHMTLGKFLSGHPVGEQTLIRIDKFLKTAGKFED